MKSYIFFILAGYLCGSIVFAWILPRIFWGVDTREKGSDHNPGTANAFLLCGSVCGSLVLLLELGKGFLPVFLAGKCLHPRSRAERAAVCPCSGSSGGRTCMAGIFLWKKRRKRDRCFLRGISWIVYGARSFAAAGLFLSAVFPGSPGQSTRSAYRADLCLCVMGGVWFAAHWRPAILAACLTGGIVILRNLCSALGRKPQICVLPMIERRYFRKVKEEQEDRKL